MSAYAWTPRRLTPADAQETIREIGDIWRRLADLRHMLECCDQGGADFCYLAAKDLATCLPELRSAARHLDGLT